MEGFPASCTGMREPVRVWGGRIAKVMRTYPVDSGHGDDLFVTRARVLDKTATVHACVGVLSSQVRI